MGKRSDFPRVEKDFYPTPPEAVTPLIPHLPSDVWYAEPCAGGGHLVWALEAHGAKCPYAADVDPQSMNVCQRDARNFIADEWQSEGWPIDFIITNPPWSRPILHQLIEHFRVQRPTWLLFDADWAHTKQAAPFLPYCHKIVSVGRVKWIKDSPHTGKDNAAWHLFDREEAPTEFVGRAE